MDYLFSAVEYLIDLKQKYWDGKTGPNENDQLDKHLDENLCKLVYTKAGSSFSCLVEKDKLENSEFMNQFTTYIAANSSGVMEQTALLDATLNGEKNITDRVNKYLGNCGDHIHELESSPKIRWLLTPDEVRDFKKLQILTADCQNIDYENVDERIGKEIFYIE